MMKDAVDTYYKVKDEIDEKLDEDEATEETASPSPVESSPPTQAPS